MTCKQGFIYFYLFCSSLALSRVHLHGKFSKITDVGIHYGLDFKDLREMHIVGGPKVN